MKKDAEKGWSGDGKTAGQSWIQEDALDPIDGCQVVYRDGNKDERVNITFSLLFRPYLGFHWEPEAFLVITPLKRLSAHQQTDRCVKWPSSEPSEAEVSFSLCFFCTKYRKITRCGLRRSSQRRPRCPEPLHVWSVSTLLLKPSDLLAWPRSGHPAGAEWTSLFFKAFLFFQEWSCSWKEPRRKRPPSVSVSEQYNEGAESEAPRVCLCVCSRDFFHVFCLKCLRVICAEWRCVGGRASACAYNRSCPLMFGLCLVRWMAAFMFLLLGLWRRVELEKKTWPAGNPALLWSQQTPGRSFVCLCVFTE